MIFQNSKKYLKVSLFLASFSLLSHCQSKTNSKTTDISQSTEKSLKNDLKQMTGFLLSTKQEVVSVKGQDWSYTIKKVIDNKSRIKKGDIIAVIDPKNLKEEIEELNDRLERSKIDKSVKTSNLKSQITNFEQAIAQAKSEIEILSSDSDSQLSDELKSYIQSGVDAKKDIINLEEKKILLAMAVKQLERSKQLLNMANQRFDRRIKTSQERMDVLKSDIRELRAPQDGIVTLLDLHGNSIRVGSEVYKGSMIAEVQDPNDMMVVAFAKEQLFAEVKIGDAVKVRILGKIEEELTGKIHSVTPVVMSMGSWYRSLSTSHPDYYMPCFRVNIKLDKQPTYPVIGAEILANLL